MKWDQREAQSALLCSNVLGGGGGEGYCLNLRET